MNIQLTNFTKDEPCNIHANFVSYPFLIKSRRHLIYLLPSLRTKWRRTLWAKSRADVVSNSQLW